jgi:hypothetical protein
MFKFIKTGVFALILISTAIIAKAQKTINQGTITYTMDYLLSADQQSKVDVSNLPKESKIQFNGNISKIGMDFGPALLSIYKDGISNTGLVLIDIPIAQQKLAGKMSKDYLEKQAGGLKYNNFKPTGEKEIIAGYHADKYTYQDGQGNKYEVWTTKDIILPPGAVPSELSSIKGTPVKYIIFQDGLKTLLTIKSVQEQKVGPFSMEVPSGYVVKTMEELNDMGKSIQ